MKDNKVTNILLSLIFITLIALFAFSYFDERGTISRYSITMIDGDNFYLVDNYSNKIYRVSPSNGATSEIEIEIDQ